MTAGGVAPQARELFGSDRLPTLLQYDPHVRLLEVPPPESRPLALGQTRPLAAGLPVPSLRAPPPPPPQGEALRGRHRRHFRLL